jgi:hypothetical protein
MAAAVVVVRRRWREAGRTAAHGRPRTPSHARDGLEKCHEIATCVRDPRPGEAPDGRRDSRSGGPTSGALHGTLAGRILEWGKIFLLRDHAPMQPLAFSGVAAKRLLSDGARVGPRRAWLWLLYPGAVWPAAAPPANAGLAVGIRRLRSNAGSNAAAYTCAHSPCAGTVGVEDVGGRFAYDDGSPREVSSPKGQPERNAPTFRLGRFFKTEHRRGRPPVYSPMH